MTKEDLIPLLPWCPWSGWDSNIWTLDKIKAIISFRYERMGDMEWMSAAEAVKADREERRAEKKAKRESRHSTTSGG